MFQPLDDEALSHLLDRAEAAEATSLPLTVEARAMLVQLADRDGRALLTLGEEVWRAARPNEVLDEAKLLEVVQK